MKKIIFFFILSIAVGNQVTGQFLVSAVQIASKTPTQISPIIGFGGTYNAVKIYKILYNTKDPFNNNTVASGAVFVPVNTCDSFPLLAYCHGTVLGKTEVPSHQYDSNYEGLYFSAKGFMVVMPDYLGLGDNPGFHPYLHSATEATATIDLMRAFREYIADSTTLRLDGKVYVTGYSQGGHAAMATLKYIQDNNLFSEFNVVAGAPMSGPYSLSIVQPKTISDSVYNYNAFSPYVINSYQYVYQNLYTNINQYYDSPYDVNIPPYLNGTSTFDALNAVLPTNIYGFMQDSILDTFMADTITFSDPLRHDLKLNDNYSWHASMPIKMCYCGSDDLVLPGNSLMAVDSMTSKGSTNVSAININQSGNHSTCFTPAISYVRTWFNSLRTDCTATNGITEYSENKNDNVLVYPNPAFTVINIQTSFTIEVIELTDISGKTIFVNNFLNKSFFQINISNLDNGFYFIKSIDNQGNLHFTKFTVLKDN